MKKLLAILLAATMCVTLLAACGGQSNDTADTSGDTTATDTNDTKTDANADMIYAVETGSAGEAAAQEKGWEINSVAAQADALMEVEAGTSDAAIVDLLMATAMTGEGTSYPDLTYDAEQKLTTEEYGIGCRKGSDLAAFINNVLAETYADGSMKKVADTYKLADAMVEQAAPDASYTVPTDGDVAYIQSKGKLVVGITEFEPMDYKDASGNWIGFDADMAKLVAEKLGVDIEFTVINWDNKIMELDSKSIDVVWNGMTLTDEVTSAMACSNAYCNNSQVVVVPADKAADYQSVDACSGLNFAVESGSAGKAEVEKLGYSFTEVKDQATALMEVAAGTADAAVIDSLMAGAMVGEGTGYDSLTYTVSLNAEEGEQYGVGFRQGSDLAAMLNSFFAASYADGSMLECAETYGIQAALIAQ